MTEKYLLIQLSIIFLLSYGTTYILYKNGLIPKIIHRRIWNVVLMLAFLTTALLGLFSVVKVNYKLDFPWYQKVLKFHVEVGVVLAIIGSIHMIWHLSYYNFILKKKERVEQKHIKSFDSSPDKNIRILLFLTGFISTASQIIFLREFFTVFNGNELIFGMVLSLGLLFSGLGALTAKNTQKFSITRLMKFVLLISWLAIVIVVILYLSRNLLFIQGKQAGFIGVTAYTALLLFFPCFFSGFLFASLASLLSKKNNKIGISYGVETIGGIVAGIIVNLIMVFIFNSFQILIIIIIISEAIILSSFKKFIFLIFSILLSILLAAFLFFPNSEIKIKQFIYKPANLLVSKSIPSGNVDIIELDGQKNIYWNNVLMDYTLNTAENEEKVHYTMLLHKNPKSVLVLSHGNINMIKEINKYKSINRIDILEPDRWFSKYLHQNDSLDSLKVVPNIFNVDYYRYLNTCKSTYDVIIINLPGPQNLYYNRLYTIEFFNRIKRVLEPDGLISVKYSAGLNYLNDDERKVMGLINNSLSQIFHHIRIVSGNQYYFLASDSNIELIYENNIYNKNIVNQYVNEYYINDYLINQRSIQIEEELKEITGVNHDLNPKVFLNQVNIYMNYNNLNYNIFGILILIVLLIYFIRIGNQRRGVFLSSFSSLSIEVIIIYIIQIFVGNAFYFTGLIVTFYMLSIALGAFYQNRIFKKDNERTYNTLILLFGLFCFVFAFVTHLIDSVNELVMLLYIIALFTILYSGFMSGAIFTKATFIEKQNIINNVSMNYSADMVGASFGAIFSGVFLVPLLGVITTVFLLGSILVIYSVFNLLKN